ncbi:MAG: class I SAM-dependent methyltransferase [Flavobacteriales bacterium]
MNNSNNWFASWFNSPFYHILYKDRDFQDAEFFISNLTEYLKPSKEDKILDLACGAGRHSIFLNSLGYQVTGVDLSPNSIETALESKSSNLNFDVHDMREVYKKNEFSFVFNLFTSFGYFDSDEENLKMLQSVEKTLKEKGVFVLDFFNSHKVISNLVREELKEVQGVQFSLKREVKEGKIMKHIEFQAENQTFSFSEKVQAINLDDFRTLFSQTNMKIIATFGDYGLNEFDEKKSDRLIIVAKK